MTQPQPFSPTHTNESCLHAFPENCGCGRDCFGNIIVTCRIYNENARRLMIASAEGDAFGCYFDPTLVPGCDTSSDN